MHAISSETGNDLITAQIETERRTVTRLTVSERLIPEITIVITMVISADADFLLVFFSNFIHN